MLDVAHYIEHEAGQLIRKARTERAKALRKVKELHAIVRAKDAQIEELSRRLRAAQGKTRHAERHLADMDARYDQLLKRHTFEDAANKPAT